MNNRFDDDVGNSKYNISVLVILIPVIDMWNDSDYLLSVCKF